MSTDLLGRTPTATEAEILSIYTRLKELLPQAESPSADANLRVALSAMAVLVTDLALDFEHLIDEGC